MPVVQQLQGVAAESYTCFEFARIGGFETGLLTGNCGHAALSCEQARLAEIVRNFLERAVI